jgi:hypothetical protein
MLKDACITREPSPRCYQANGSELFIAALVVAPAVVTALFWLISLVIVMRWVWQWTFA